MERLVYALRTLMWAHAELFRDFRHALPAAQLKLFDEFASRPHRAPADAPKSHLAQAAVRQAAWMACLIVCSCWSGACPGGRWICWATPRRARSNLTVWAASPSAPPARPPSPQHRAWPMQLVGACPDRRVMQCCAGPRQCSVCRQPPTAPFEAPCRHMGCYACWVAHLRQRDVCPHEGCGAAVHMASLTRLYLP